jgi:glycosyltransferase involved in cell wall biosynthesis
METKPILSICIPTYNRSHLLRQCLECLITEFHPFANLVEIIVSNNSSNDDTEEVVEYFSSKMKIKYHKHNQNIGACLNINYIVTKIAIGEFCWVIGDDDILRKGAVEKVLNVINSNQNIDYIFVNHSYEAHEERGRIDEIIGEDFAEIKNPVCHLSDDKYVDKWEDIIMLSETPALYTSIVCSVFRRNTWSNISKNIIDPDFSSMRFTFPHTCILADHNVGKPAYYIGYPYVAFFVGGQEWLGSWNYLLFRYVLEFSDHLENLGVSGNLVDKYRNLVFGKSFSYFSALSINKIEDLRLIFFHIQKYWKYANYWKMIFLSPIYQLLRLSPQLKNRVKIFLSLIYAKNSNQ